MAELIAHTSLPLSTRGAALVPRAPTADEGLLQSPQQLRLVTA